MIKYTVLNRKFNKFKNVSLNLFKLKGQLQLCYLIRENLYTKYYNLPNFFQYYGYDQTAQY